MQLRLLHYFVVLAREKHFARAAEACGVTQPTISSGISTLEESLGKRLVMRDRRFLGLTAEGMAMLPWAQQLVATFDGLKASVVASSGPITGELKLGCIPAALPFTGELARALVEAHPGVTLAVRSLTSREIERDLGAFELHAGLTYLDHEPPADVVALPLYTERYMFVTRSGASEAGTREIEWADAVSRKLCLLHQGMQNRRILDAHLGQAGLSARPVATADSYISLLAMVRAGDFATILPDTYTALIEQESWASVRPLRGGSVSSRVGLIVLDRQPVNPMATALVEIAQGLAMDA